MHPPLRSASLGFLGLSLTSPWPSVFCMPEQPASHRRPHGPLPPEAVVRPPWTMAVTVSDCLEWLSIVKWIPGNQFSRLHFEQNTQGLSTQTKGLHFCNTKPVKGGVLPFPELPQVMFLLVSVQSIWCLCNGTKVFSNHTFTGLNLTSGPFGVKICSWNISALLFASNPHCKSS